MGGIAFYSSTPIGPPANITPYVFLTCLLADSGGLMYGYDLVVAGNFKLNPIV